MRRKNPGDRYCDRGEASPVRPPAPVPVEQQHKAEQHRGRLLGEAAEDGHTKQGPPPALLVKQEAGENRDSGDQVRTSGDVRHHLGVDRMDGPQTRNPKSRGGAPCYRQRHPESEEYCNRMKEQVGYVVTGTKLAPERVVHRVAERRHWTVQPACEPCAPIVLGENCGRVVETQLVRPGVTDGQRARIEEKRAGERVGVDQTRDEQEKQQPRAHRVSSSGTKARRRDPSTSTEPSWLPPLWPGRCYRPCSWSYRSWPRRGS